MTASPIELRDVSALDDCRAVVRVQEEVWGRDGETVPASVLFISAKRGGILIGAYAASEGPAATLVGFVWSIAGLRDGAVTQWSHMLGVLPAYRRGGVAARLKAAQRERALAAGIDLIEWTFDPLQAMNAHFNLHVLGAVGASYGVDVYGALSGPLHRGTPTDRLIVEWRLRDAPSSAGAATDAPAMLRVVPDGAWLRAEDAGVPMTTPDLIVPVPPRFLDMQHDATDLALDWRLKMRGVMTRAFAEGYRAVDFRIDRERGGGAYVLQRDPRK